MQALNILFRFAQALKLLLQIYLTLPLVGPAIHSAYTLEEKRLGAVFVECVSVHQSLYVWLCVVVSRCERNNVEISNL